MMPVAVVAKWRLWVLPLLAAAVAGYAAFAVQGLRLDAARADAAREKAQVRADLEAAHAAAQAAARAREQAFQTRLNEATHEHQQALARVRADGGAARADLDRLRDALAAPYGLSVTAGGAGGFNADPARVILGECAAAYLDLAQQADGHAVDVRLLLDGWPQ